MSADEGRPSMRPAPKQACVECPWLLSNAGREHPQDWYSREQTLEYWRSLRGGRPNSCHLTEADREVYEVTPEAAAAGYRRPSPMAQRRECAGSAVLQVRELRRFAEAGSYEAYREAWPAGFTFDALRRAAERDDLAAPTTSECEVVDVPSWPDLEPGEFLTPKEMVLLTRLLASEATP